MNFIKKIRSWPIKKKRAFSISVALFITILIIIFNTAINLIWENEVEVKTNNSFISVAKSFSKIFEEAEPIFNKIINNSRNSDIINQTNSTSSIFSTTSNIVELTN
jgi:predicted PurR-regulated permease PerM